jgi:hypothetical protein
MTSRVKTRVTLGVTVLACAAVLGGTLTGAARSDTSDINASEALSAIQTVAPESVADLAHSTSNGSSAVVADVGKGKVAVPVDAADGVSIDDGSGGSLNIGLPFADRAGDATRKSGVTVYDNGNGSSTVPVAHSDGSVQISTVISDANAPHNYAYALDLSSGQSLASNTDGSVSIVGDDGSIDATVNAPWAKDANGQAVSTHYTVHGNTLTQVVDFTSQTAFPVVADPTVIWQWWGNQIKLSKSETKRAAGISGSTAHKVDAFCAFMPKTVFSVACLLLIGWKVDSLLNPIKQAGKAGQCAFINIPLGQGVMFWNTTRGKC